MSQKVLRQMNDDVIPIPLDSEGNVVNRSVNGMYNAGIRLVELFHNAELGECTIPVVVVNNRDYENHRFNNDEQITVTYKKYKAKIVYVNSATGNGIADTKTGALRGPVETGIGTQELPYVNLNSALRAAECYVKTTCGCFVCIKLKGIVDYQICAKATTCGVITGERRVVVEAWDTSNPPVINPAIGFQRYIDVPNLSLMGDHVLCLISVSAIYFKNIQFVWRYVDNFKAEIDAVLSLDPDSRYYMRTWTFVLIYGNGCYFDSCTFTGTDADYLDPVFFRWLWLYRYTACISSTIQYTGHQSITYCDQNNLGLIKNITLTADQGLWAMYGISYITSAYTGEFICLIAASILDGCNINELTIDLRKSVYYRLLGFSGTVANIGTVFKIRNNAVNINLNNCEIIGASTLQEYEELGYQANATFDIFNDTAASAGSVAIYDSIFNYQYHGGALYYTDAFNISTSCDWDPNNSWQTSFYHCTRMESCSIRSNHFSFYFESIYDCEFIFAGTYWIGHNHDMSVGCAFIENTDILIDDDEIIYTAAATESPSTESDGRYEMRRYPTLNVNNSAINIKATQRFGANTARWYSRVHTPRIRFDHRLESSTITINIDGYMTCYVNYIYCSDVVKNNTFTLTHNVTCPKTMTRSNYGDLRNNYNEAWIHYILSNGGDGTPPTFEFTNNQITMTHARTAPQLADDIRVYSISSDASLLYISLPYRNNEITNILVSNNTVTGSMTESYGGYYSSNRCTYYDSITGEIAGSGGMYCDVSARILGVRFDTNTWQLSGITINVDATATCNVTKDPTCCSLQEDEYVCLASGETGTHRYMRYYSYNGEVSEDTDKTTEYSC